MVFIRLLFNRSHLPLLSSTSHVIEEPVANPWVQSYTTHSVPDHTLARTAVENRYSHHHFRTAPIAGGVAQRQRVFAEPGFVQ